MLFSMSVQLLEVVPEQGDEGITQGIITTGNALGEEEVFLLKDQ